MAVKVATLAFVILLVTAHADGGSAKILARPLSMLRRKRIGMSHALSAEARRCNSSRSRSAMTSSA